eukprot:12280-Heterococcus_DN1.PRE.2
MGTTSTNISTTTASAAAATQHYTTTTTAVASPAPLGAPQLLSSRHSVLGQQQGVHSTTTRMSFRLLMLRCRAIASAASQLSPAISSAKQAAVQRASRFFTIQSKTLLLQQSAAVRVSLCSAATCVRNS